MRNFVKSLNKEGQAVNGSKARLNGSKLGG